MPSPPEITLRPHHLLCCLGYQGMGYSDAFTANMSRIVFDGLRAGNGDATRITLTNEADAICAPCPSKLGTGCIEQAKITALDRRHAMALGLAPGAQITWGHAKSRIVERIDPDDLPSLCATCKWEPLGVCADALRALKRDSQNNIAKKG